MDTAPKTSEQPRFIPVLLGGDANAYGMARSFYEEYGIVSHGICKGAFHICQNSRILSIDVQEPDLEDDETFVRTLIDYAKKQPEGVPLILAPCGDNYTKMLVRNQEALRPYYLFSIMTPEQFDLLSTKSRFYSTCERYNLVFPETTEVCRDTAAGFEPPFPYPVVVKPSNSVAYWNCDYPGKKKVFVVRNAEEMRQILEGVYSSSYDDTLIVQDFVPGDDTRMRVMNCYSSQDGKVRMMCLGDVVLEEHTPLGIGSYGAIVTSDISKPEHAEIAQRIKGFLEDIGYIGYSNFDLKYDERDGSFKLFEINPRQGRASFFCTSSGMNLARYLVRDVLLNDNRPLEMPRVEDEVLWTMVPTEIIRTYTSDPAMSERTERLISAGRVAQTYWCNYDKNPLRAISYRMN